MPDPHSAASTCSTVPMRTLARPSDVLSRVSTTFSARAGISTPSLQKTIPVYGGAGARVRRTFAPEWRPIPSIEARCRKVRWRKGWRSIISCRPSKVRQRRRTWGSSPEQTPCPAFVASGATSKTLHRPGYLEPPAGRAGDSEPSRPSCTTWPAPRHPCRAGRSLYPCETTHASKWLPACAVFSVGPSSIEIYKSDPCADAGTLRPR